MMCRQLTGNQGECRRQYGLAFTLVAPKQARIIETHQIKRSAYMIKYFFTAILTGAILIGMAFSSAKAQTTGAKPFSFAAADMGFITVTVEAKSASDLGGFEFKLSYPPEIVKIADPADVTIGAFLASTGRTVSPLGPSIDNTSGKVTFGGYSYGTSAGASGDGVLASIKFTVIIPGNGLLELQTATLTDSKANLLAGATVEVSPSNTSPCPTAKVLGADNQKLENVRGFRDGKLVNSAIGRKLIQLYYANADSINAALDRSPALRAVAGRVIAAAASLAGK